jgi:microcystin degradation protein MlrC
MRIAVAGFEYEGNSFSNKIDGRANFADKLIAEGADVLRRFEGKGQALSGGIETLRAAGHEVVPVFATRGGSGGCVEASFAHDCIERIVTGIEQAAPIDGVYLALHGAMITEDLADPEGELLMRLRGVLGPSIPIAASLDLHAHVTHSMVEAATILVGYETYPHEDAHRTGACAASLLVRTLAGEINPVMVLRKINAIVPVLGGATTGDAPMAEVAALARRHEGRNGVLSVSYFPVQPWLDHADVGITGLAIAGTAAAARDAAEEIVLAMWERRHAFELEAFSPREAVRRALALPAATVLIVDAPDAIGAGSPGDSPAVIAAILAEALQVDAAVYLVDPAAAQRAHEAGVGATLELHIGGAHDQRYSKPIAITATVESLHQGTFVYRGGPARGATARLGPSAVLRVGGLRLLAATNAVYEYADEHYAACGIDIAAMKLVSCKNLMNFRTLLRPDRDHVVVHGPGASPLRLQDVSWSERKRPFWPVDNPEQPEFIEYDMADPDSSDNGTIDCDGHGKQPVTLVCLHLVEADHGDTSMGFNWSVEDGEFVANCDACEAACDADGYFPDELVEDNFALICKACLDEIALAHGVKMAATPAAKK